MSNFIKYYCNKDSESKEATHEAIFFAPIPHNKKYYSVDFWENDELIFSGEEENFDQFIKNNNFKEVKMTNNNQLSSNPLQLKMPVVGRRYKNIISNEELIIDEIKNHYTVITWATGSIDLIFIKTLLEEYKEVEFPNNFKMKMPIIKERYRYKVDKNHIVEIERFQASNRVKVCLTNGNKIPIEVFWDIFEELPNQDNGNKQVETEKKMEEENSKKIYPSCNYEFLCIGCGVMIGTDLAYYFLKKSCATCEAKNGLKELEKQEQKPITPQLNPPAQDQHRPVSAEIKQQTFKREWFKTFDVVRVEKAKEELRVYLSVAEQHKTIINLDTFLPDLQNKAQNLLNALDEIQSKLGFFEVVKSVDVTKEKGDCGIGEEATKHYNKDVCTVCNIEIGYSETGFDLSKVKWYHLDKCYDTRNKDIEEKPKSL